MEKCVIEARINEYAMRNVNPNVPWTMDEIVKEAVAVQQAGASVLHIHARTSDGGPDNSVETNAALIRRIRKHSDLFIHSTLGFYTNDDTPEDRIRNIVRLCAEKDTGPDIVPIDTGTLNLESYDRDNKKVYHADNVYLNTTETILKSAEAFSKLDCNIQFFCWGPSFVRRAEMLMNLGLIKKKPHFVFHLTGGMNISCNPLTELGLESMLEVLPPNLPWAVASGGTSIFPLLPYILNRGGNVSIGLGDYGYPELNLPTNAQLVTKIAEAVYESGREVATIDDTRRIYGIG